MNPQPSEPSEADKKRDALLKEFRAYLHLAITAHQTDQAKNLEAMPGPQMRDYCHMLAKLPGNTLARELAAAVGAVLEQLDTAAMDFYRPIFQKKVEDSAKQAELEVILEQLDLAVAFILRRLLTLAKFRAGVTKSTDLLCDATGMAIGNGVDAARLIRYGEKNFPEISRLDDGSIDGGGFPGRFAWDVYQRVEALDKLADEFPDQIRMEACQMHAWPMLMHRHTNNRRRFQKLAKLLELGAEYPTDASEGARFRPDTPMVRYLEPIIRRLHTVRYYHDPDRKFETIAEENKFIGRFWWQWPEASPGEDILKVLRADCLLPPLTKATAAQWAEKAIVPLILVTDARDWVNCTEPVLQAIRKQKGVKSRATFKSRLLAAVSATLRRLARPA